MSFVAFRADGAAHAVSRKFGDISVTEGPVADSWQTQHMDCELITDPKGFFALEEDWNALFAQAGAPHQLFQTYAWQWHWVRHYLDEDAQEDLALRIIVGRRNGQAVLIWPLVRYRWLGMSVLAWMGEPVSQYGDVLVVSGPERKAYLHQAWQFIRSSLKPDLLLLRKVRDDAAVMPLLQETPVHVIQEEAAPFTRLSGLKDFDDFSRRFSGKVKKNRRRQRRRLSEAGAVSFAFHAEGPEAQALVAEAFRLKREWLKRRALISRAFCDDRMERFFQDVAGDTRRSAGCRVAVLQVDDRPVALEIALLNKGHLAVHINAHDPAYERHGPGILVIEDTLRMAIADAEITTYDQLAPADPYKMTWADEIIPVRDFALARSWRGRLYADVYLGKIRKLVKWALLRIPAGLRRRLLSLYRRLKLAL